MLLSKKTIRTMKKDREKGFTLIELMIVVAILGILAAIAIPNFMRFQAKSKQSEAKTNLGAIGVTAEAFRSENDTYVLTAIGNLGWTPQGTARYSYWYDVAGTPTAFNVVAAVGGCDTTAAPTVALAGAVPVAAAGAFNTVAEGQIDTDAICDGWNYNQLRALTNPINDVST